MVLHFETLLQEPLPSWTTQHLMILGVDFWCHHKENEK